MPLSIIRRAVSVACPLTSATPPEKEGQQSFPIAVVPYRLKAVIVFLAIGLLDVSSCSDLAVPLHPSSIPVAAKRVAAFHIKRCL